MTGKRAWVACGVVACVLVAGGAVLKAQDVLQRLGVGASELQESVVSAVQTGQPGWYLLSRAMKAVPLAARGEVVTTLLSWVRAYVESDAFRRAWAERRLSNQPRAPAFEGTVDDELRARQEEQRAAMAQQKAQLEQLPPEIRKGVEDAMAQQEEMLADPEMQRLMRQGMEQARKFEAEDHQRHLAEWRTEYPEDPRALVAARLKAFLGACADVKYDAELVTVDRQQRFADPALERKPAEWKLCYRTGPEGVEAARAFATSWLADLSKR
jgi:hypothetical protein